MGCAVYMLKVTTSTQQQFLQFRLAIATFATIMIAITIMNSFYFCKRYTFTVIACMFFRSSLTICIFLAIFASSFHCHCSFSYCDYDDDFYDIDSASLQKCAESKEASQIGPRTILGKDENVSLLFSHMQPMFFLYFP